MHKTSSPYLKELYKGEIKWFPFNAKTLAHARRHNKVIFIHIGYAGNVQARENAYKLFGDERVTDIINNNFIPIAIDMEDVPEAMLVGMDLLVLSSQQYTIPVNIFSLPSARPFTSFSDCTPEEFINLAQNVIYSFSEKRELLEKAGDYMAARLKGSGIVQQREKPSPIEDKLLHAYVRSWMCKYTDSGVCSKKSPYTINSRYYIFLLKYAHHYNKTQQMKFIFNALDKLYYSPMFDSVEGGVFSQAVNNSFSQPLYEKQFSENIQAAVLYALAYKYNRKPHYKEAAMKIIEFIEKCLKTDKGGYITCITLRGSLEDSSYYKFTTNVQRMQAHGELLKDTRVITAYNCMYASSLCLIANIMKEKRVEYTALAERIVEHILANQKADDIKLYRYISANKTEHQSAQLLDYSLFLNALLNIYKYSHKSLYDKLISKYTAFILLNYYRSHNGMFSKTDKAEDITPFKRESIIDYVRYSANSVMANNLLMLYKLRKDDFFISAFKQQIYNISSQLIGTGPLMVGWALQILNFLDQFNGKGQNCLRS